MIDTCIKVYVFSLTIFYNDKPKQGTMDDLLALMEGGDNNALAPVEESVEEQQASTTTNNAHHHRSPTPTVQERRNKPKRSASQNGDAQIDNRLGVRMTQRNMGSLDLADYIQTRNYHSPATLAGMSLVALNQSVLLDPTPVVDAATVCGRTNLLTVGVVFFNSGTKIASTGKAFAILTIGSSLQSGPCVSVMMFGPAYSKYCQAAKPGLVVAIEDPRLLPAKHNDNQKTNSMYDTAISFSINDERQLSIIAKARDYGVCQATVKGKNAQGQWVNNVKRCPAVIDTRVSKYCQTHRKLENVQSGPVKSKSKNNNQKGTFIQQQRQELNVQPIRREGKDGRHGALILPNNKGDTAGFSRLSGVPRQMVKGTAFQRQTQQPKLAQRPDSLRQAKPPAKTCNLRNNSILNPQGANKATENLHQLSKRAPLVDALVRPSNSINNKVSDNRFLNPSVSKSTAPPKNTTIHNPYAPKPKPIVTPQQNHRPEQLLRQQEHVLQNSANQQKTKKKRSNEAPIDWLGAASAKKQKTRNSSEEKSVVSGGQKKKATLNTSAMGGFDGQVPVPKPSKLFVTSKSVQAQAFSSTTVNENENQEASYEDILAKQRLLAQQQRKGGSEKTSTGDAKQAIKNKVILKQPPEKSSLVGKKGTGFFDTLPEKAMEVDHQAILNAKSRFATEADAEAYAASRRRVTELEQEEARKEASNKKKTKNGKDPKEKVIAMEWICRSCNNRRSRVEPKSCIRMGHQVISKRILNKSIESKEDKRTNLSSAAAEDGGITLGSGLEWSRFPSSRFS